MIDAKPRVVLTQNWLWERLPETGAWVFCLNADWAEVSRRSDENPPPAAKPDNAAYVNFAGSPFAVAEDAKDQRRNDLDRTS